MDGIKLDLRKMSLGMRDLLLRGSYEIEEKRLCKQFLVPSDRVLEIGAAIGYIGLFCQLKLGITQYSSVEADPATLEVLLRNYALNGVRPVAWNYALAAADGVVSLYPERDFWATTTINKDSKPRVGSKTVPSATMSSILSKTDFSVSALIVDIEGAEMFLQVAALPATIKKIIIELHPHVLGNEKSAILSNDFAAGGFRREGFIGNVHVFVR